MDTLCRAVVAAMVLALLAAPAFAQKFRGDIVGVVVDATGAALPGTTVTAKNEGTELVRTVISADDGSYRIPELPVGSYRITASLSGFKTTTLTGIKVNVGLNTTVNIQLEVGEITEVVTVVGEAPLVDTSSNQLATLIGARQVTELPLNGRDWIQLATLAPGVTRRVGGGFMGTAALGIRRSGVNWMIDGTSNNDPYYGDSVMNQTGIAGQPASLVPIEAMQEFVVHTTPSAEYGVRGGIGLNIVMRSGTNDFHGTAFYFHRNDALDAHNFFDNKEEPIPEFKNNQFGFVASGPIWRNRTFFLTTYEGQRERVGSTRLFTVPTPAQLARARAELARRGIPISPISEKLVAFWPAPNLNVPEGEPNLVKSIAIPNRVDSFVIKIDHKFNDQNTLVGRYMFGDSLQEDVVSFSERWNSIAPTRAQLLALSYTTVISSTKLNEFRFGWNRFSQILVPADQGFDPLKEIGLDMGPMPPEDLAMPGIDITGFDSFGGIAGYPLITQPNTTAQFMDNFTWTRGRHTIKFGVEFRRAFSNNQRNRSRPVIDFDGSNLGDPLLDFLAGRPAFAQRNIGSTRRGNFIESFDWFVQDDFKLSRHLMLYLGLRYELNGRLGEERDRLSNFLPDRGLVKLGDGLEELYDLDVNNFAPRFGFAWDPAGKGKTAIRAGFGIYYDLFNMASPLGVRAPNARNPGVATNPIGRLEDQTFSVSLSNPPWQPGVGLFAPILAGARPSPPFDLVAIDPDLATSYYYNFNLNIQQQITRAAMIQVGYVGTKGTKLLQWRDINAPTPGPSRTRNQRRPFAQRFPDFQVINMMEASGTSNYHSLQIVYNQKPVYGLSVMANYTLSKAIDQSSFNRGTRVGGWPQNPFNLKAERGLSAFDMRHKFTLNFIYDLPEMPALRALGRGWQINGIVSLQSGRPFGPHMSSFDNSGTRNGSDRPNLVGPIVINSRDPNNYANRCAFQWDRSASICGGTNMSPFTFGNAGKFILVGPGFNNIDFSVTKNTRLTEAVVLQFRWEIFNLFNHANFAQPNGNVRSGAFGTIDSTPDVAQGNPRLGSGGPRVMQVGLKLQF